LSKSFSGSTGPIFTKFSPSYGRYLIVDCRFDPFPRWLKDVAIATNFRVKSGQIDLYRYLHSETDYAKDSPISMKTGM